MSIDTFEACVEGYQDHLFDLQLLSVQNGFWSGYYGFGSKHPKTPDKIAQKMIREKDLPSQQHVDDIDVEEFLRREQQFQSRLAKGESNG